MYRRLNADLTVETIERLKQRIEERFPDAGLVKVCSELLEVGNRSKQRSAWIARPHWGLRLGVTLLVALITMALIYTVTRSEFRWQTGTIGEMIQVIEAALNEIVLIGAAIFFLITVETRIKRSRALEALHELRAIAHVIDMHQLTKDPSKWVRSAILTPEAPLRGLSTYDLMRYLDYCSEMLSLTGKIGALYAQNFQDPVVLSAVNDLEDMTTSMSRKIWQKIMILHYDDDHVKSALGKLKR